MNIKFSIIIPAYNAENSIQKSIDSILNQTYNNYEIIVVNDGSTDNTINLIEKNSKIKIINQKNLGVSSARNTGIENAKGDFIAFIDADDYIEKNYLEEFNIIIEKYNPDLIICGINESNNSKIFKSFLKNAYYETFEDIKNDLVTLYDKHLMYTIGNKIYKRDLIIKHNIKFSNISFGEDNIFNQDYIKVCNSFYNTKKCLYNYIRQQKNSVTTNYIANLYNLRVKENKQLISFFENLKIKNYEQFTSKRFINRTIGCLENVHKNKKLSFKEKYKLTKEITKSKETIEQIEKYNTKSLKLRIIITTYKIPIVAYCIGWIIYISKILFPNMYMKNVQQNK